MTITVTFDPPLPSDSPATFNTKAFTLLGDLNTWSTQANAVAVDVTQDEVALAAAVSAASGSASAASGSASSASTSASTATTQAGIATTKAGEASASAAAAAASAASVNLGNVDINGGTIDGAAIGSTTPAAGAFTTVTASSPITLTSANPYVKFVGTAASQQWRIGDGLNATNGNLVVYDYTGSIKALEITKATGAVTIPGKVNLGPGAAAGTADLSFGNSIGRTIALFDSGGSNMYGVGMSGTGTTPDPYRIKFLANDSEVGYWDSAGNFVVGTQASQRLGVSVSGAVTIPGTLSLTGGTFGYGTGAGGTVTQATSKSTPVTLHKPSGVITMNNAAMASGDVVAVFVTNSFCAATSTVAVSMLEDGATPLTSYLVQAAPYGSGGAFYLLVKNISGGSLSDALKIRFAVITGANA